MIRTIVAALFIAAVSPGAAEAACTSRSMKMRDNETVSRIMIVQSGKSCTVRLGSSMGPMETTKVVKAPSHGTATVDASMAVKYAARAGYNGPDTFSYARIRRDRLNKPTVRTIDV